MSSPQRPPLSALNPMYSGPYGPGPAYRPASPRYAKHSNVGQYVLWFVILAAVIWLGLYLIKPRAVLKRDASGQITGEIDPMRVFWYAVIASAIITAIIYLVRSRSA